MIENNFSTTPNKDGQLIAAAKKDPQKFGELYNKYATGVYNY